MGIKYANMRFLVGLLKRADQQAYDQLSRELRGQSDALPVGGNLGANSTVDAEGQYSMHEACSIAAAALKRMRIVAKPAIAKVGGRLRASNGIGLVGEIVAAIGTAGVIAAIWGAPPKDSVGHITSIWMAVVALGGTIASLVARFLRRDISGADGALTGAYQKLVDGAWEAEILGAKLEAIIAKGVPQAGSKEAAAVIERAEKLAADIFRTVNAVGEPIGTTA